MKEDNGAQGVGATAFDLPNSQNPKPRAPIHYGPQHVPHPCNYKAEMVDHAKVMRQVNEAK
jgi:hypothetical protein